MTHRHSHRDLIHVACVCGGAIRTRLGKLSTEPTQLSLT